MIARYWWVRDFLAPATFLVVGRVVAALFQSKQQPLNNNLGIEITYDIAVLIASLSFIRWSATWGVPAMMADVRQIARRTQEPSREFLRELATENIRETRRIVEGLTSGSFLVQNPAALKTWFARFFAKGGSTYIGVDSHRPAQFMSQYEWYLEAHANSLQTRGFPRTDKRVLATPRNAVTDDFRVPATSHAYQRFCRWHETNDVDLRWIDIARADPLRRHYGATAVDVALWEKFAVVFCADERSDAITLDVYFPNEPERNGTTYESLRRYVYAALRASDRLDAVSPRLGLVPRELAAAWKDYVAPEERAKGRLGKFLLATLRGKVGIFDAAAGIGCDSVFLIKEGFEVVTNEVDEMWAQFALQFAEESGLKLQLSTLLWETLPDTLAGGLRFEAVLCLGNSLCLVEDQEGRLRCLEALRATLRDDDGVLIIDERNFQYMLDHQTEIESDPINAFRPTVEGDYLYCGRTVRGYPAHIDRIRNQVKWRFFKNRPEVRSLGDIGQARLDCDDLTLHAFAHGELFRLLEAAGFRNIRTYADFIDITPDDHSMPSLATIGDAQFLTYVASRGPIS